MDWLDLLGIQVTLKSRLQHHSSKVSILQHSAFFTVQLSHPYRTTGKKTNFPQCIVIHTVEGFGVVSKAEIDVFVFVFFSGTLLLFQ